MQLGRYQVLKELAAGSVADVLLARASGLEGFARHVVLKRLRPELARDQRFVAAFLDEARIAGALHHQNIVQVHDIGEQDGSYFFAMEYVHGEDLRKLMARVQQRNEVVPIEHAIAIASGTAAGLHHAHEQKAPNGERFGLVHRDVSPSNILIGYDGSVKLVDFGMAKVVARSTATASGALKTKASYMSPEQCTGKLVDRRTDIFALGIVLFELVTAQRLFKGNSEFLTMAAIVEGDIPRPSTLRREVPPALDEIIMRALQKSPEARYQSAEAFRESLEAFAIAQELRISSKALADYLVSQFGARIEPWEHDAKDEPRYDLEGTIAKGVVPSPDEPHLYAKLAPAAESPLALARAESSADDDNAFTDDDENLPTQGQTPRTHARGKTEDERPPRDMHRRTRPSRVLPAQTGAVGDTTATHLPSNVDDPSGVFDVTTQRPVAPDDTSRRDLADTSPSVAVGDQTSKRSLHDDDAEDRPDPLLDVQTVLDASRTHALLAHPRHVERESSDDTDGGTVVELPAFASATNDDDEFGSESATKHATDAAEAAAEKERAIARRAQRPTAPPATRRSGSVPTRPSPPAAYPAPPSTKPSPPAGYHAPSAPPAPPARPSPPAAYPPPPISRPSPPAPIGRASPPGAYPAPVPSDAAPPPPPARASPPSGYPSPVSTDGAHPPPAIASGSQPPGYAVPPQLAPAPNLFAPPPGSETASGTPSIDLRSRPPWLWVIGGAVLVCIATYTLVSRGCSDGATHAAPRDAEENVVEPDAAIDAPSVPDAGPSRNKPATKR